MKLQDIEALLNIDAKAEIDLYEIPIENIREMSNLYGTKIHEQELNRWTTIKGEQVTLCLNTSVKH